MAASKWMIESWLKREKAAESDYMLVVCDTFDHEDYPVYVSKKDIDKTIQQYSGNMQTIMEIYNLSLDIDAQLAEKRAWHIKD